MTNRNLNRISLAAAATAIAGTVTAAENKPLDAAIARIQEKDDKVRSEAWQNAASFGASAIKPLASLLTHADLEVTRAAKRSLAKIVRTAGRPGADSERKAAIQQFLPLLAKSEPAQVRREALWLLSELGGNESVGPIAALLSEEGLREDARMVLQRIPGQKAVAALKDALAAAPEVFKPNIAVSLRQRGVKVAGYPSQKLTPSKQTTVKTIKVG